MHASLVERFGPWAAIESDSDPEARHGSPRCFATLLGLQGFNLSMDAKAAGTVKLKLKATGKAKKGLEDGL